MADRVKREGRKVQMGVAVELGVPNWIKELVGDDWSNLTQKVVVTFDNERATQINIKCFGRQLADNPLCDVDYERIKKKKKKKKKS